MLHVLSKKSKSKKLHQRGQRPETSQDTRWDALEVETKSATPDYRNQRKFRRGKEASVLILGEDRKFGGSIRTRSTSSRRSCSAMVTFESIKPTQVWQASASPSPPTTSVTTRRCVKPKHPVDSLALSMIAQTSAENQWLSLSTGDEDDLSDSTDDDEGAEKVRKEGKGQMDSDRGKRASTSTSHRLRSSPSSSDSSSSFELSRSSTMSARHRRKKQSSRRHRRENAAFSSGTPSTSSDSSSSSSSEEDNEFDLCWKMKAGGSLRNDTAIQSTPQLKRTPHHHHHHHHHQSLVLAPTGTPQVMQRYPSTHYNRPQTLNLTAGSFPRPMSARSSSKDLPFVQTIARAVEDFFPTLEWIEKYKVISVHRGDLLRIIPYPGTNPDKTSPTTGWFLAQKWCADHGSGTSPIGFIPRIICSFVCPDNTPRLSHISPRHARSHDYSMKMAENTAFMTVSADVSQATSGGQMSANSAICDTFLEPVSARSIYPSPQLSLHTPCTTAVKTSFTSIPAVYEIEDRDSGRGPSSGSEWSSGKGGSLSGATDINVDDKDQPQPQTQPQPQSQQQQPPTNKPSSCIKWSPTGSYQRRSSFDQQSGSNFSCPLPPPPMALLSHVCTVTMGEMKSLPTPVATTTATAFSVSDTEAGGSICSSLGTRTRLYVRGSKPLTSKATEGEVGMENNMAWRDEKGGGSPLTPAEPVDEEEEGDTSGSPQSTVVVVSSNSDPAHWEPYKTMIQVGQNKLEKFTLV
ncbi:hypothetical transcript [Echinococcus multilocularis]|uniref:Hypothetical transcript n=1 Tax=Echinococcus multilocularis TaxID=6211 RepID=A0A077R4H2_ECHMU|nr:hypothetical transcript [Echinococcus multilocularis]